jgi:two-component system sensor histidine kinase/response regulator
MANEIKILVVDDDRYLLDLLIETLRSIGYDTTGVQSAAEALKLLETTDYKLLITDIKMPEMDGLEFTRKVKRNHPDLPVIFITGVLGSSVLRLTDADGYLSKPFRIGQMEELIKKVLENQTGAAAPDGNEHILVVDDDDTFRLMLMETLKLSGYSVIGASGGREAVALLEQGGIDSVIADIKMPEMDGISLTRHIKKTWPGMPVIMITGYLSMEDKQEESDQLADGFLMKPFKIESITELLESLKKQRTPPLA